ncbi:unnamed protein product, partial [Eruca vesicaria subsp. sativa]|nr:unnamed protein product [Eruca vesicaria subsp. sativa]
MTSNERGIFYHHDETLVKCPIPFDVFTSKTLVKLTLGTGLCIVKQEVYLPVLKSLFLYTVNFEDGDFSHLVLRGCPVLEELYIHRGGPHNLCHPTIKRITIHRSETHNFNTPNLVYLDYSDRLVNSGHFSANFLDSLLEARLDLFLPKDYSSEPWKVITCICNVQILHLSSNTVELMLKCFDHWDSNGGFPFFRNLVKLSFDCKTKKGWKVLWSLINNSPKLETLILKGPFCSIRRSCEDSIEGNVLKELKICGYEGTRRELFQVQRFLLELKFLQVMKVEVGAKKIDDDKKLKLTKDLL